MEEEDLSARPTLSDIQPTKTVHVAGGRVLVRAYGGLNFDTRRSIRRAVRKYCGEHVRVLIVDVEAVRVSVQRAGSEEIELLAGREHAQMPTTNPGVVNFRSAQIEFQDGDRLFVWARIDGRGLRRKNVEAVYRRWAGPCVEVVVLDAGESGV